MVVEIKRNFERLISLYENEKGANRALRLELEQARKDNEAYQKKITDLQRQVDNLTLAGAFSASSEGDPEAKKKIDGLIRDIDRCIALLEGENL